jgi:hypothetical protein
MNTPTVGGSASHPVGATGLAGLAVRAGRALERWGSRLASARPTRDELARAIDLRREAQRAVAANEAILQRSDLQPLR